MPLSDLFRRLVDQCRAWLRAEIALYRAEATIRGLAAGWALGYLVGALMLASAALITLLVGLVMWIGTALNLGWAILIVVGITLLIAALLGWLGVKKITAALEPDKS